MNNVCDMAGQGAAYAADGACAADGMLSLVSGDADTGARDVPLLPLKEKDVPFRASRCQAQPMASCPDKAVNTIPFVGSSYDVPQAAVPYQDVLAVAAMGDKAARVFPDADATKAADLLEGRLGYRFVKRLTKEERKNWGYAGIWEMNTVRANKDHPAMYPVELPWRCIKMHSDRGDIVLEPFSGSGTTIIACEQLERVCYAMEKSPEYCDLAVKRWEQFTGQKAERITSHADAE